MKSTVLVFLLAWMGLSLGNPGVVFEIETTYFDDGQPTDVDTVFVSVEGKLLSIETHSTDKSGAAGSMIYRGDRDEMITVNHKEKSYVVIDKETVAGLAGQISDAMKQVQERLKDLPEGQRTAMEKMLKEQMKLPESQSTPSEIKRTNEKQRMHGYPCVKYIVLREGVVVREIWVTDWDNVEGSDEANAALKDMAAFFDDIMSAFESSLGQFGGGFDMTRNPFSELDELDGFPIVTRYFSDEELTMESAFRSAQRRTLDPAAFEPPSGYKRQEMRGR